MLRCRLIVFALLTFSQAVNSQVDIQILVKQSHLKQAKLYFYQHTEIVQIDSTLQSGQGFFRFTIPPNYKKGIYKFALGKNISFDFVVSDEAKISLETIVFAAEDSVKSIISKENELFFHYKRIKKSSTQQFWFLNSLVDYYSDTSSFRKLIFAEIYKIRINLNSQVQQIANNNPDLFVSNLIHIESDPIPIPEFLVNERRNDMINGWWNDINLQDKRFLNSPLLLSKLWKYFELYFDERVNKEQQDSLLIQAVTAVMNLNADPMIKGSFRDFLFKSFIETEYNEVTKYLNDYSVEGLPRIILTPETKNSLEIQVKNGVGTKAKDFALNTLDGVKLKLSKVNSSYKVIFFWSLWCPHCTEMIPELYNTYIQLKSKGIEFIAICIDDEPEGWKRFVNEKKYCWINAIEPDNGESKIIKEYAVDGTPKFFMLDKDLTIISKPTNVKQLEVKLKEVLR